MAGSKKATKATRAGKTGKATKAAKTTRTTKAAKTNKATKARRTGKVAVKKAAARKPRARKASGGGNGRAAFVDGLAKRLGEHRREILHLYRHDLDVGLDSFRDGDDEIDRANFDSDRDLALSLSDGERETLLQIEEALHRIDRGDYGSCTSCAKPIGDRRLDAIPWARYCIDCQELEEKGLLG